MITKRCHHLPRCIFTSISTIALLFASQFSSAQVLEEVVVTAQKREQSMQDVPISVAAVSRMEIEQLGAQTMGDITASVPNFSFQNRGSILGNFGMRGIVTNIANAGVESAMAVYIDGILAGRPETFDTALTDVEQIEVLRGPQGTLFGKNTIAGAVNIRTARPTDEQKAELKLEAGRYNRGLAGGFVNFPVNDKLFARVSGQVERQDGWIQNLNDDRDFNGEDNYSARIQLLYNPSDDLEIYWTANRFFDDRNFIAQVNDDPRDLKANPNVDIDEGLVDVDSPSTSKRDIWGTSLEINYNVNGYTITSVSGFNRSDINSLFDGDTQRQPLSDTKLDSVAKNWSTELRIASPADERLDWVAGGNYHYQKINNSTQTRFFPQSILAGCNVGVVPNTFRGFPPGPPFEPTSRIRGFDANGLPVWDFDLNGNGIFNEASVTIPPFGLFGVSEDVGCHNPDLIAFGRHLPGGQAEDQFVPFFDGPLTAADVPEIAQVLETGTIKNKVYAVFANANYRFSDRITFTGGVRHTWEDKDLEMEQIGMINIQRPSFVAEDSRSDREWSGTAAVTFSLNEDINLFARYSHGFKSGGFQFDITQGENVSAFAPLFQGTTFVTSVLAANPAATKQDVIDAAIAASADPNIAPADIEFGPENVNAFEWGFKSDLFDSRVRLNASGFYTEYNNVQQNITRLSTGIVVLNVPGAEIWGFDMDITAAPAEGLVLSGGIGYAKSELTEPLIINNPQNAQVPLVDTSAFVGQRLAQAPEWTANASAMYTFPFGDSGNIVLRGDWSYTGDILHELVELDSAAEDLVTSDDYNILNIRVGYVSERGNWDIYFWAKNVLDERYDAFRRSNPIIRVFGLDSTGNGLAFPGATTAQAIAGEPMMWGFTLSKRFE